MGTDAPVQFPQDVCGCHEMIRQLLVALDEARRDVDQLTHRLAQLLQARFGPRAEKVDPAQLWLFAQEVLAESRRGQTADAEPQPVQAKEQTTTTTNSTRHGRRRLPESLPRQRVVHDLSTEERLCPDCGTERVKISEEVSEQVEYVPASLYVIEHVRPKYACKQCQGNLTIADKPNQPIEKGLPGPGLLAQVAVSKYSDHLPLYRLERIFQRHGLELPRSTTCGWMAGVAELLSPLHALMVGRVLQSKVIHTDDTPVGVQQNGNGQVRQGRVWVYVGDPDHPYTVFDYTPTRSQEGPARFLAGYSGCLQADAYPGYDAIYAGLLSSGKVIEVGCWAHTRRKFYEARTSDPARAHLAMAYIQRLYHVEREGKALDATTRASLRQAQSRPILTEFKGWLQQEQQAALPKSPIGQAISYTLSNWEALLRYTDDGELAIDNNAAENALRAICLGRKNGLFFGSDKGGKTAAVLFGMIASCKRHRLDPYAYLRDVIGRISDQPLSQLEQLLPDRWKQIHQPDASSPPRPPP